MSKTQGKVSLQIHKLCLWFYLLANISDRFSTANIVFYIFAAILEVKTLGHNVIRQLNFDKYIFFSLRYDTQPMNFFGLKKHPNDTLNL